MEKPKPSAVAAAAGISLSYASMLLSGDRAWTQRIAIDVFRGTGFRFGALENATEEQIDFLDTVTPPRREAAAA